MDLSEKDFNVIGTILNSMEELTPAGKSKMNDILSGLIKTNNEKKEGINMNNNININTENVTIPTSTLKALQEELSALRAQVAQLSQSKAPTNTPIAPNAIAPESMARVAELEQELARMTLTIEVNAQNNITTPQFTINRYKALSKEYEELMGISFKAKIQSVVDGGVSKVRDYADSIGAFGQQKIANDLVPNTIKTATDYAANLVSIATGAIAGIGNLGAATITSIGDATSNAAQSTLYTTFNVIRK